MGTTRNSYKHSSDIVLVLQEHLLKGSGFVKMHLLIYRALESNRGSFAKFCLQSLPYKKSNSIPTAHTCFNRMMLPEYPTKELLKKNMDLL